MRSSAIISIVALAATALAAPTGQDASAKAKSYVINSQSDVAAYNGLVMSSYHVAAGQAYAILVPHNASQPNGGAESMVLKGPSNDQRVLFLAGENGSIQEGLIIPGDAQAMMINAADGTDGFYVERGGSKPELRYSGSASSAFYACKTSSLPYGPATQVFHVRQLNNLPKGCGVVDFFLTPAKSGN